jgi:acyl-CoA dehydrogenase
MPSYKAPVRETLFLLNDVFGISRYADLPGFSDLTPETLQAMLEEAAKLAEDVITPLNRVGDVEGCQRHPDASVTTPKGFREAYQQLVAGGWVGIAAPEEFGGQGLPETLSAIVGEFHASASLAFSMYGGLTQGAIAALLAHASPDIKAAYLPDLIAGKATGTMNLTEAHAGSDVGLSYARARKEPDGSYRLTGSKVFISAGEHDLAENIIHLVLARIEGAPPGTKGLSLFVVPKFLPGVNEVPRERNRVSCGSIEKKMGIHGNCTCVLNYDDAKGWLIGGENGGMPAMFVMMNHSRLFVGGQGLGLAEVAYQNAAAYARERLQSRSLSGRKFPEKPADPIIVHGDVRRMLMSIRAFTEAARALIISSSLRNDVAMRKNDPAAVRDAENHMALLTPVIKAFTSDRGFLSTVIAQQVYGGHGYIAENGMEQFVRDSRVAQIYEGTNGIQALDLVGRKLGLDGGRVVRTYFAEVESFLKEHAEDPGLAPYVTRTREALGHLQEATEWLAKNGAKDRDLVGCGAWDYLNLFGLVALAHMWCQMAEVAQRKLAKGTADPYLKAKLVTGRFFVERMLPETQFRLACVKAGGAGAMDMPAELF